MEFAVELGIV